MDIFEKTTLEFWRETSFESLKERFKDDSEINILDIDFRYVITDFTIQLIKDDEEFQDNFRIMPFDKKDEYDLVKNSGCCGFSDWTIKTKNEVYLVGYNYGH